MGSRKKLILASLVSVMMILACAMVLVPVHNQVGAATNGRVSMADLLNLIVGRKALDTLEIATPEDGSVIKVRIPDSTAAEAPAALRAVSLSATATDSLTGDDVAGTVYYFDYDESLVGPDQYTELGSSSTAPYSLGFIDAWVASVAQPTETWYDAVGVAHTVYAYASASKVYPDDAFDDVTFTLQEFSPEDANGDGIPDNPFDDLLTGEQFVDSPADGVVVATTKLDCTDPDQETTITIQDPDDSTRVVTVTVPSCSDLFGDTLPSDIVVIVKVADDLEGLLGASEAAEVSETIGVIVQNGKYILIGIIYATPSKAPLAVSEFDEVHSLPVPTDLIITGLDTGEGENSNVFSYPTEFLDGLAVNVDSGDDWTMQNTTHPADGTVAAELADLSIFAPIKSAIAIYAVVPDFAAVETERGVEVQGNFPVGTALNMAEAAAAYQVFFGTRQASFQDRADAVTTTAMQVTTPAVPSGEDGLVDVRVVDLNLASNYDLAADAFTFAQVRVSPSPIIMTYGSTRQLAATTTEGLDASYTWASGSPLVASVSATGLVTAGSADGTAVITATGDTTGIVGQAFVQVASSVDDITVSVTPDVLVLTTGVTAELLASSTAAYFDTSFTWATDEALIAPVTSTGAATADVTGGNVGQATVTATGVGSLQYGRCVVTVVNDPLGGDQVTVTPSSATLVVGNTLQLSAASSLYYTTPAFIWRSSDTGVATVSSNGLVTATGAGAAQISALNPLTGAQGFSAMTVVTSTTDVVTIDPDSATVVVGNTLPLVATSSLYGTTPDFVWASSDTGVATVTQDGLVTAVAEGAAQITALNPDTGAQGASAITVVTSPLGGDTVTLTPSAASVVLDNTLQLAAASSVYYKQAPDFVWWSSDTATVSVDQTGLVTGEALGAAQITALNPLTGATGNATITVVRATVTVSPSTATVRVNRTVQLTATSDDALDTAFTWASSDTTVATVSATGLVTGESVGTVTITATGANSGEQDTATITVQRAIGGAGGILALLLGLLAAGLGLAAGGDGDGGGGPCFIATAAYGTPMADDIDLLRAVRDTYLLDNALGTAFVDTYYRLSPAIADIVAKSPVLAAAVRLALVPVILAAKLAMSMPTLALSMVLGFGALVAVRRRRKA